MRALIVEDDFSLRKLLKKVLSAYGECAIAVNGEEAIEAFEQAWGGSKPYDLICMDIRMPKLNGMDALHKIRQFEQERGLSGSDEVKVIMTTGSSETKQVIESLYKWGASAYFVKPIDLAAFVQELEKLGLIDHA